MDVSAWRASCLKFDNRGRMTLLLNRRSLRIEVRFVNILVPLTNMALIEEIEDDKRRSPSPIKVEEITDEEDEKPRKPKVAPPPPAATSAPPAPVSDFQKKLQDLTSKMALPSDLLPAFMSEQAGKLLVDVSAQKLTSAPIVFESYKDQVQRCLARLFPLIQSPDWASLSFEEQASTLSQILRLRGNDAWTSPGISDMVDSEVCNCAL